MCEMGQRVVGSSPVTAEIYYLLREFQLEVGIDRVCIGNSQSPLLWKHLQYGNTGCGVLERFLPKNQHTQRKLLNFEFWINGDLSKSAKI